MCANFIKKVKRQQTVFTLNILEGEERLKLYAYVCSSIDSLGKHQETGFNLCFGGELEGSELGKEADWFSLFVLFLYHVCMCYLSKIKWNYANF